MTSKQSKKYIYTHSDDETESSEFESIIFESSLISNCKPSSNDAIQKIADKPHKATVDYRKEFVDSIIRELNIDPLLDANNITSEFAINNSRKKKIKNINKILYDAGYDIKYIKSGSTGHTFKAQSKIYPDRIFAIKVCAYSKDEYGSKYDPGRPENVEISVLAMLSNLMLNKVTPHLVMPLGVFHTSIQYFADTSIIDGYDPKLKKFDMYRKFIKRYNKRRFDNFVSVLIVEWCNGGDLLDYIKCNYKKMTLSTWKILILQLLITLAKIHERYPTFRHNDMKANNILVQITDDNLATNKNKIHYRYDIQKFVFAVPDIGISIKIWDFDFASIDGKIENNKVNSEWTHEMNITNKPNKYYDMHYFFNSLMSNKFLPKYEEMIPVEIIQFVKRIIPDKYRTPVDGSDSKYVNSRGRIQVNHEYTTPYNVITKDELFSKYRFANIQTK